MEKKDCIIINGVRVYHGDRISAIIESDGKQTITDARLCINNLGINDKNEYQNLFICQNEYDGDNSAEELFGYEYSWIFKFNEVTNEICSADTYEITSLEDHGVPVIETLSEDEDDDPMPENWICEEKIPDDI